MASIGEFTATFLANVDGLTRPLREADGVIGQFQSKIGAAGATMTGLGASLSVVGAPFALMAKNAIDSADAFFDMSQKVGISVETLSAFSYAAEISGTTIDAMETGLKKLVGTAFDAAEGSKAANKGFAELGIAVTDAHGQLKSADELMLEVADKFAVMEDGSTKAALAVDLFGRSGMDLIPFLNEGSDGIGKLADEAKNVGRVITSDAAAGADKFNDAVEKLNSSIGGLFNAIGASGLLSKLADFADRAADVVSQFARANPMLMTAIGIIGGVTAVFGPLILAVGLAATAIAAMSTPILAIFGVAGVLVAAGATISYFASENETVKTIVSEVWNTIKDTVGGILEGLQELFQVVSDAITAIWDVWGDEITAVFSMYFDEIKTIATYAWGIIKTVFTSALDVIKGAVQIFTAVLTGDWDLFTKGIGNIWSGLWELIKSIITAPLRAVKDAVSNFTEGITGYFRDMYNRVAGNSYVPDMLEVIEEEFEKLPDVMVTPAKDATDDVKSSFSSMFSSITDAASKWQSDLTGIFTAIGGKVGDIASKVSKAFSVGKDIIGSIQSGDVLGGVMKGVGAAIGAIKNIGAGRRAADEFGEKFNQPMVAAISSVHDAFFAAAEAGTLTVDEAEDAKAAVMELWDTFKDEASQFARQSDKHTTVVQQAFDRIAEVWGRDLSTITGGFDSVIDSLKSQEPELEDTSDSIRQIGESASNAGERIRYTSLDINKLGGVFDILIDSINDTIGPINRLSGALDDLRESAMSAGSGGGSQPPSMPRPAAAPMPPAPAPTADPIAEYIKTLGGNPADADYYDRIKSITSIFGVPSFQHGSDFVPRTGLAMVHQGEKVTPAYQNQGSMGEPITVVLQIDGREIARAVIPAVNDQVKYGGMQLVASEVR